MATIGLDKLYYAKITENDNGDETYGTPTQLANIALNCEGSEIAGIGDPKGAGSILLKDAELDMTMLAASVIDVGTRCGSVSTQGGRKSVRINP